MRDVELGNFIFDKGLYQLSREKMLLIPNINLTQRKCMLNTALDLPEDTSHRSVLAIKVQDFPNESCRFVKLGVIVYYKIS